MDRSLLDTVCNQIYRQFPEVNGCRPIVHPHGDEQSLLIFQGKATTGDGKILCRTVRVVVNQSGKIMKVTTSRG
jgi:hypothetical protein